MESWKCSLLVPLVATSLLSGACARGERPVPPPVALFEVNPILWRASLGVVDFLPVTSADPKSGVITTGYYTDPQVPNERMRFNVYILDRKLRADGLRVRAFRETYADGSWTQAKTHKDTEIQMEALILARARTLWAQSVSTR